MIYKRPVTLWSDLEKLKKSIENMALKWYNNTKHIMYIYSVRCALMHIRHTGG